MQTSKLISLLRHPLKNIINKRANRFNPYMTYARFLKGAPSFLEETKEAVLITIIGGAYGHTFEGLFARKAALQGKNVHILRCGAYLDYCDVINIELSHKSVRCAVCLAQQEDFIKAFGGVDCTYSNWLTSNDEQVIDHFIDSFFCQNDFEHVFKGTYVDKILYSALQRYYLVAEPSVIDDKVTRGFLRSILLTLTVMDKLVKKIQPKYVLSSHGTYSTWGAVVEYCKAHNVYVVTYGQNYNHCGIEFTYDDSYLTGVLNDTDNKWAEKVLTEKEYATVKRFLDERLGRVQDEGVAFDYNKNNKTHYTREQLNEMLSIDANKKLIGLFPNIPWDGQVTGGTAVFPNFRDWLKTTVDYFAARDDAVLVIRSHPAEVLTGDAAGHETTETMLKDIYTVLPRNVLLVGPKHQVNSYTLGENSDFAITYSSTVTLELTYLGIPVILCGCPPFKDKNVAFDITSQENYIDLLNQGSAGNLIVDQARIDRLFRYLHYFFFMRTMPQTLVDVHDTVPQRYLFTSEEELDADPVFDEMFKCIENKTEMDFSRFYK